ncbi:MAG: trypsin-like peptidase domain-containing protein [Planctomycetota bacterium]
MRTLWIAATLAACPLLARADDDALARAMALQKDLVALAEKVSPAFVAIGGGSGVIVSPEGDVVTNHHVAGGRKVGETWQIMGQGGTIHTAIMVGTDESGDISLLKIQGEGPFPYAPLGDSDKVQVGDPVVALGNPFGFSKDGSPHVTMGIVSAVHRYQGGYSDAIQTDTPINPGNSGGPLLNFQGEVIGINGKINFRWGNRANSGIGYAIPANQIKTFIPAFRAKGEVDHGTLKGVRLADTPNGGEGCLVRRVSGSSQAYRAGLREGDVVLQADGREVHSAARLRGILGTFPADSELEIVVSRDGQEQRFTVAVESAVVTPRSVRGGWLGIRMQPHDDGVEIASVTPDSPAAKAGIESGDLITALEVEGRKTPVKKTGDFIAVLGKLEPGAKLTLIGSRGPQEIAIEVTLGEWPQPGKR